MGFEAAFQRLYNKIDQLEKSSLIIISTMAERHYRDSFKNSGFTDQSLQRWQPLKNNSKGYNPLVKSGQLRGSVRANIIGNRVIITSDRDYARFHNEGIGNNPKRQFIGLSHLLNRNIRQQIIQAAKRIFN